MQCRCVDRGVIAARPLKDPAVERCGFRGQQPALPAFGRQGAVLCDARQERGYVLLRNVLQPVLEEPTLRLLRRAGPGQGENGPVLEPGVGGMLGESTLGEIEGSEQLAPPLLFPNRLVPPVCGPLRGVDLQWPPRRGHRGPTLNQARRTRGEGGRRGLLGHRAPEYP